jgi:serine/threonine protein kinase
MPDAGTHPTQQQLAAFGLGKLPEPAAGLVARHLETCALCRQAVAALPPDSFVRKVHAARPEESALPVASLQPGAAPSLSGRPAPAAALSPSAPPELAAHPRYRILRELGRGGMGVVYQARQTMMNRQVVIKVINQSLLDRPDTLERFHREVQAAAQLAHPNIVTAYDAEQAGQLHMLVMEFVPGQSLAEVLQKKGPLPVAQACDYIRQAALGLQHAFERGMVHRDLKPANLMLTPQGQVKILDFGLAKVVSENRPKQALTALNSYMGTPEYSAPEQATDARAADIRADLYSLGCTLYCLLASRPPYQEDTPVNTILAHLEKQAVPLPVLRQDVPAGLWAVVARLLAKEPERRYEQPAELALALAPFCATEPAASPPTPAPGVTELPRKPSPGSGTVSARDTRQLLPLPGQVVAEQPRRVVSGRRPSSRRQSREATRGRHDRTPGVLPSSSGQSRVWQGVIAAAAALATMFLVVGIGWLSQGGRRPVGSPEAPAVVMVPATRKEEPKDPVAPPPPKDEGKAPVAPRRPKVEENDVSPPPQKADSPPAASESHVKGDISGPPLVEGGTPKSDPRRDRGPQCRATPDAAALAEAEQQFKETYKSDLSKRTPDNLRAMGAKFLHLGLEAKDKPAGRFVFLREAYRLAAGAGDLTTAFEAIDALAKEFAVSVLDLKTEALDKAAQGAPDAATRRAVFDAAMRLADAARDQDNYEAARHLLAAAKVAAFRLPAQEALVQKRTAEVDALRKEYEAVKPSAAVLAAQPRDPVACLAMGQFLCFHKGDWNHGLILLAWGNDPTLASLAGRDLVNPDQPAEQEALGDAWFAMAETATGRVKACIQRRAYHWYNRAVPALEGLAEARVEKRIRTLTEQSPELLSLWDHVDLGAARVVDGVLRLTPEQSVPTRRAYSGSVDITIIARTEKNNIRMRAFRGGEVIFNWECKQGELRVARPDGREVGPPGSLAASKPLPLQPNTWYVLRWRITPKGMDVSVDGQVVFMETSKYDLSVKQPVRVAAADSVIEVKSFIVKPLP